MTPSELDAMLTCIDLFAGAGGSSLGAAMAGVLGQVVAAVGRGT